jgi:hypothetical protein
MQPNTTFNLTSLAVGIPAPTYQWFMNGNALSNGGVYSGVTSSALTITGFGVGQTGNYYVVATSGNLTLQSNTAIVGITPTITGQPVSQTVVAFSVVRFTVTVVSGGSTTYQWYFEGAKAKQFTAVKVGPWIKGPTAATLTITRAGAQFTGSYYVIVKSGGTSLQSKTVTLAIKPLVR